MVESTALKACMHFLGLYQEIHTHYSYDACTKIWTAFLKSLTFSDERIRPFAVLLQRMTYPDNACEGKIVIVNLLSKLGPDKTLRVSYTCPVEYIH